jgi:hypothetical protein
MRELTAFQRDLKAAFKLGVERAGGGVMVAEHTGYDCPRISRYGNPDDASFPPLHIAHAVDRLCGEPLCLQVMAREWGFTLTPTAGTDDDNIMNAVASFCDKAGELSDVTLRAASDGHLSNNEKTLIRSKLAEVASAHREIAEIAAPA